MFSVDRIADLTGGANAFQEQFWTPFYATLLELRRRDRFSHRLVAALADYTAGCAARPESVCDPKSPDYTRLVPLPELTAITRKDLLDWFHEMDVADSPAGFRAALANRVMTASTGLALRAFDRLRGEILWPPGDAHD
jgi:hypothetical protein